MGENNADISIKIWGIEINSRNSEEKVITILIVVLVFILIFTVLLCLMLDSYAAIVLAAMIGYSPASALIKVIKAKKNIDP